MRRFPVAALLLLTAACGDASSTSPTPTPTPEPPSTSATPASVLPTAGDGQEALPGFAVTVNPAVVVKDVSGTPVAGATVAFAVDSGGGSIVGSSVTTSSNGVATVGGWTLGPNPGRNVLRVTVGTLAPVRIVATGSVSVTATYPPTTIGVGGGSVTITDAGPLNGFSLSLPSGAFGAPTQWAVSYRSNVTVPRTPGVNPITPLITISGSTGAYASSYLSLTLPLSVPTGMIPFVVLRDPATGKLEVLNTQVVNATSVTAVTQHLNGAHMMAAANAASVRQGASMRGKSVSGKSVSGKSVSGKSVSDKSISATYDIEVFATAIKPELLDADYDTGFRPGTDDWSARSTATYPAPEGICAGLTITSMWYFLNQKQNIGQLYGRFALAPGVPNSVKVGLDWATVVQLKLEGTDFKALNDYLDQVVRAGTLGSRDLDFYHVLKAQMLITRAPQFVVVARSNKDKFAHAVIAWKTVGGTIYVADPNFPGNATNTILFGGTRFTPYAAPDKEGGPVNTFPFIATIGLSQLIPLDLLNDQWPSVADSTIGRNLFPSYSLHTKYGALPDDTLWLSDTLRIWYQCPSCRPVVTSPDAPEATASLTLNDGYALNQSSASWTQYILSYVVGAHNASKQPKNSEVDYANGILGSFDETSTDVLFAWIDWHQFARIKVGFSIASKPVMGAVGVPVPFTGVLGSRGPAHLIYRWDFGDNTAKVSNTDKATVNHTYTTAGDYIVIAQLLDARTQQMIAADTSTTTIIEPFTEITISGNWPNQSAPQLGTFRYTDLHGNRIPTPAPGVDGIFFAYDNFIIDNTTYDSGIDITLVIPTGSALRAGQTFTKFVTGPPIIGAGQFQLTLAADLNHPEGSCVCAPGNTGTLTITAVNTLSDGSTAISYRYVVSNGLGGSITGTGVGGYR